MSVPPDPQYAERVAKSFSRQQFMSTLGAELESVAPGEVVIKLPFGSHITQQHGFVHAGALSAVVDSACGYAALTLMPPGTAVLAVEFKVNFMAPASGDEFYAKGTVVRAGRTLTVCSGEVRNGREGSVVSIMQSTIISLDRPEMAD